MKKHLLTLTLTLPLTAALLLSAPAARAADTGAKAPATSATKPATMKPAPKKPVRDFATVKAARLQHLDAHIAKLQKARSCVAAATDRAGLATCWPKRHHKKKKGSAQKKALPKKD